MVSHTEQTCCPACEGPLNAVRLEWDGDETPPFTIQKGDVSVCQHCGTVIEYCAPGYKVFTAFDDLDGDMLEEISMLQMRVRGD